MHKAQFYEKYDQNSVSFYYFDKVYALIVIDSNSSTNSSHGINSSYGINSSHGIDSKIQGVPRLVLPL